MSLDFSFNLGVSDDSTLDVNTLYDVLIIGAGAAGLNAGIYAKRKGLNVGIIAGSIGGQMLDTSLIENYLGYTSITGFDLSQKFEEHTRSLSVPIHLGLIKEVKVSEDAIKTVILEDLSEYKAKSIIIATGSIPKKLNAINEAKLTGKGVAYCAICDGPFYRNKDIAVVGGGNTAVESAIDLAKIANKVVLIVRSKLSSDQILIDRLSEFENIEIIYDSEVVEVVGENTLESVIINNRKTNEKSNLNVDGLFIEIGANPNSKVFTGLVDINERGEIVVDRYGESSQKGIFAAGDVSNTPYKQVIMAAGDGAKCALAASEYINKF